jgi:RNA polymerase sigma factor (sigma-70 family)
MGAHMKIRPQPAITPELLSDDLVADLVRAAAAGDEHAWNALVAKFSGLLWAIARAHRLYHADAADVVQVTWLRLLEQLGRLRNPSRVGAWLATTARRECLRVLRHSERVMCLDENARERQSNELGPDDVLLERERDGALWRGFTRLRTSDQELLRLLVVDPRPPYEEIAAVLDMPIGSIGPTRQRALKRLRHELDGEGSLALVTPERRSSR